MARPQKTLDMPQFLETLGRMAQGRDHGSVPQRPDKDAKVERDVIDSFVQGRKIEDYKQALEYHGFIYVPADRLPTLRDGTRATEGQWRSVSLRMAFTENEVLAHFPRGPEEFDVWCQGQLRARAARSGLILPH